MSVPHQPTTEPGELPKLGLVNQHVLRTRQHDRLQPKARLSSGLFIKGMYSDLVMTGNSKGWLLLLGADLVEFISSTPGRS